MYIVISAFQGSLPHDGYLACTACMVFGAMTKRKSFFFSAELISLKMPDI